MTEAVDERTLCDTCGHDQGDHYPEAPSGCGCSKFQYGTPPPRLSISPSVMRFLTDTVHGQSRDSLEDVLEDLFGRSYSREMKGLLRAGFREGLSRYGFSAAEIEAALDEKALTKMWATQQKYTRHLKNDLRSAINGGRVTSVAGLEGWFSENDYRSSMTGRFMAWQGVNAGFARAADLNGKNLRWRLGARERHCSVCLTRDGRVYTYSELLTIGFPGSDQTLCKAACGCTVSAV